MKSSFVSRSLIGALLFSIGLGTGFFAQSLTDSPQRVERKRGDLAGAPGMEVIVSTAEYKPGESIDLHLHHGAEAVYVIQGATVQAPGKEPSQIPTGASLLNPRDVKHAGFAVVGETSLKLFTVHVVDKDKPLYDYAR
ncbi:MAG: cupin domain-containing protein [Rhizobacter sp.]